MNDSIKIIEKSSPNGMLPDVSEAEAQGLNALLLKLRAVDARRLPDGMPRFGLLRFEVTEQQFEEAGLPSFAKLAAEHGRMSICVKLTPEDFMDGSVRVKGRWDPEAKIISELSVMMVHDEAVEWFDRGLAALTIIGELINLLDALREEQEADNEGEEWKN
jgi:hypothetical protein